MPSGPTGRYFWCPLGPLECLVSKKALGGIPLGTTHSQEGLLSVPETARCLCSGLLPLRWTPYRGTD